ncbi:unnamed protein product [Moneuplotes crassus]|uniref:Uncharacterized protein n=1 Tax=Euplotes crassus TaxID=5936 RepID=A0AAD1Y5I2_EUPCR|nr:unnamed protein product [Moneuplotes crassus]
MSRSKISKNHAKMNHYRSFNKPDYSQVLTNNSIPGTGLFATRPKNPHHPNAQNFPNILQNPNPTSKPTKSKAPSTSSPKSPFLHPQPDPDQAEESLQDLAQNKFEKELVVMLEKKNTHLSKQLEKMIYENERLHKEVRNTKSIAENLNSENSRLIGELKQLQVENITLKQEGNPPVVSQKYSQPLLPQNPYQDSSEKSEESQLNISRDSVKFKYFEQDIKDLKEEKKELQDGYNELMVNYTHLLSKVQEYEEVKALQEQQKSQQNDTPQEIEKEQIDDKQSTTKSVKEDQKPKTPADAKKIANLTKKYQSLLKAKNSELESSALEISSLKELLQIEQQKSSWYETQLSSKDTKIRSLTQKLTEASPTTESEEQPKKPTRSEKQRVIRKGQKHEELVKVTKSKKPSKKPKDYGLIQPN